MAIPTFPERTLESEDSPPSPSPFPELVSEVDAIVGEDSLGVSLEGLRVIKETSYPIRIASALTISASGVAYTSLVTTRVYQLDRARWASFFISYTPGVTGAFPILYPQFSAQDMTTETFAFLPSKASTISQYVGPTDPPTFQRKSSGAHAENLFEAMGIALVAATPVSTYLGIKLDGEFYPSAAKAMRFAIRDSNPTTPGTIIIVATQG